MGGLLARASRWVMTPILVKELRATFRGWRFYAAHGVVLSLFALILLITLIVWMTEPDPNPSKVGRVVFAMFAVFQAVLVVLVLPAFGCTSVVGEKERKSFDLLLTTTLTPAEIVWGKFTATMTYSCLFLISTLPLVSIAFLFGGVSLVDLGFCYAYLLVSSVLLNLYAVFISTTVKTSQRGVVICYLFLAPLVIALGALGVLLAEKYLERLLNGRAAELTFDFENTFEAVLRLGAPAFLYAALLGFFFLSATNRLKSPTANHSTSFRIFYVLLVAGAAWIALWLMETSPGKMAFHDRLTLALAYLYGIGAFGIFSQVFAAEEPVLPLRLRTQVGRMTGVRAALRPMMPGSVNGAVFCVLVNGLVLAASVLPLWYGVLAPESFPAPPGVHAEPGSAHELARAVPFTAACIFAFLCLLSGAGVLFSTMFRRTSTAKGMLGLLLLAVLLVPLIAWLVVVQDMEDGVPKPYGIAVTNLPMALVTVWFGLEQKPIVPFAFNLHGRSIPYSAAFCGAHVALGLGLFLWGMLRRRRLVQRAELGPTALAEGAKG